MNQRQDNLLRLLSEAGCWMKGRELAGLLGVSDRTVRSDISIILSEQTGLKIRSSHRFGYRITDGEYAASQTEQGPDCGIPAKPSDRYFYILMALLERSSGVNLIFLKNQLFFSDSSIGKDLVKIRQILKDFPGLTLNRSNRLLCLKGTEFKKRGLYQKLLSHQMEHNILNLNNLAACFKKTDLICIWNEMEHILNHLHYELRESSLSMLAMYLGITMERIMTFHYCRLPEYTGTPPEDLKDHIEYQIAEHFFNRMSKIYGREIPQDETHILTLYFIDRQNFLPAAAGRVNPLPEHVMELIFENYHVDLRRDRELLQMLRHHISILLYQNWVHDFEFPLSSQDIKSKYPLSFEIACFISNFLTETTGHTITETEISFIALHLQCAYERQSIGQTYRLLIICPYNHNLLTYFLDKMITHFGERAVITGCLPLFEKGMVAKEHPDLILTTFPLKHSLDIPTLQISLFMDASDENKVFEALNTLDTQRFRKQCLPWMATLVRPEFFYTDSDAETPEEIIRFLCGKLTQAGYIPESFTQSVLDREQMSTTAFAYQFSLPHSLNISSYHSVLSVALLKKPIAWGPYEISLVLLPAIAHEDRRQMQILFNWLGNMIMDPAQLSALLESRSWLDFQTLFQ